MDTIAKRWLVTAIENGKLPFYELGRGDERISVFLPRQPHTPLESVWRAATIHRNKLNANLRVDAYQG